MEKRFQSKKLLSLLLVAIMLLALLPIGALASTVQEACPDCHGATNEDGSYVECNTCGSDGLIDVTVCDDCNGRNGAHTDVCSVCGACGGKHVNVCSVCSQCGNSHTAECSSNPNNAACEACGGTVSNHLNVCSECGQCNNTHTAACSHNPDNSTCPTCGEVYNTAAGHTCTKCAHCHGTLNAEGACTATFTITFKNGETTIGEPQTVACGGSATAPAYPANAAGITATGWSGTYTNVAADATVTATFPATHTVTFKNGGATIGEPQTVVSGGSATAPAYPVNGSGVTATGWDKSYSNVTADLVVNATFPEAEDVVVDIVGGNTEIAASEEEASDIATSAPEEVNGVQTVSVSGNIVWPGSSHPSLKITLRQNGVDYRAITTRQNTYSFPALPATDGSGASYIYTLKLPKNLGASYPVSHNGNTITVRYNAPVQEEETVDYGGGVIWMGLPDNLSSTVTIALKRGDETIDTKTVTGNSVASFLFEDLAKNDASGNAYSYSVNAAAGNVDGYTASTPSVSLSPSVQIMVTYSPDDTSLASLVQQFSALIEALPSYSEAEALYLRLFDMDPDNADYDAANEVLSNYSSVYNAAVRLYESLPAADKTRFSELAGTAIMEKYQSLALAFGMMVQAAAVSRIPVTLTFRTTSGTTTIPVGTYTVTLKCSDTSVADQTHDFVVTTANNTQKTFSHAFTVDDGNSTGTTAYTYTVEWPAAPTNYIAIAGARNLIFQETNKTAAKVVVNATFESGQLVPTPPDGTTVDISVDGNPAQTATLSKTAGWSKTFASVSFHGSSLSMTATCSNTTDYTPATITQSVSTDSSGNITITFNVHFSIKLNARSITGNVAWYNIYGQSITPPQTVTVSLYQTDAYATGVRHLYATAPVYASDSTYAFLDIPYADINGNAFRYGLEATYVPGYTISIDGTSTVSYWADTASRTHLNVKVNWNDTQNKRGLRPVETTVYLYRGSEFVEEKQVGDATNWTVTFPNLDRYYANGKPCYYSVRGAKISHYYSSPVYANGRFSVTLTYHYGYRKSTDTTTSSNLTPKVGDPTLIRSALSDRMYSEAAKSMEAVRNAAVLRENETVGSVDFDTLKRINKEVVGWITLDGTDLDYPIVKGTDNTKYLTRLFSGEANSSGSLFMDYHNNSNFGNRNTTVFGHNMKDGSMFNTLLKYADQSFYQAHPSFSIQTPDGAYTAEPIAAFYTDSAYSNVVKRTFANNAAFLKYVDKCIRASSIQSEVTVSATDKLVTFVTCDNDYTANRRFLVVCKLSPVD